MSLAESAVQDTQMDADQDAQVKAYGPLRDADDRILLGRNGDPLVGTSVCPICKLVKPLGMFYFRGEKTVDGVEYFRMNGRKCKDCWQIPITKTTAVEKRRAKVREEIRHWKYLYRTSTWYLFDRDFAERLFYIASTLKMHDLRNPQTVYDTSSHALLEIMPEAEVILVRTAIFNKDQDVLYFLFDHPLQKPYGQAGVQRTYFLNPDGQPVREVQPEPAPESTAGVPGEAEEVAPVLPSRAAAASDMLDDLANGATGETLDSALKQIGEGLAEAGTATREKLEELAAHIVEHPLPAMPAEPAETITDEDIEAAAELIINARKRKEQLQEVIDEYIDRLNSLRLQLDEAEGERQAAIALLRKA